ncbi:MAG: hypothetical protein RL472_2104, partial [Pseudomonadota bacterium]
MTPDILIPEILVPGQATLAQLEHIWRKEAPAKLHPSARAGIDRAAGMIH